MALTAGQLLSSRSKAQRAKRGGSRSWSGISGSWLSAGAARAGLRLAILRGLESKNIFLGFNYKNKYNSCINL
jgi:hypothetical protein